MIVRINQHDLEHAERSGGWASTGLQGPIPYDWPAGTTAMELLILETDERNQVLARTFRQMQIRTLIPEALFALLDDLLSYQPPPDGKPAAQGGPRIAKIKFASPSEL